MSFAEIPMSTPVFSTRGNQSRLSRSYVSSQGFYSNVSPGRVSQGALPRVCVPSRWLLAIRRGLRLREGARINKAGPWLRDIWILAVGILPFAAVLY